MTKKDIGATWSSSRLINFCLNSSSVYMMEHIRLW